MLSADSGLQIHIVLNLYHHGTFLYHGTSIYHGISMYHTMVFQYIIANHCTPVHCTMVHQYTMVYLYHGTSIYHGVLMYHSKSMYHGSNNSFIIKCLERNCRATWSEMYTPSEAEPAIHVFDLKRELRMI